MLFSIIKMHFDSIHKPSQTGICAGHVLEYSDDEIVSVLFPDGMTIETRRKKFLVIDEIDLTKEAR